MIVVILKPTVEISYSTKFIASSESKVSMQSRLERTWGHFCVMTCVNKSFINNCLSDLAYESYAGS